MGKVFIDILTKLQIILLKTLNTSYVFSVVGNYDERLASAWYYAYDVVEIRVPNKKNLKFGLKPGLWASYKPIPVAVP